MIEKADKNLYIRGCACGQACGSQSVSSSMLLNPISVICRCDVVCTGPEKVEMAQSLGIAP